MVNVDEVLKAMERPVVILDDKRYEGRLLSAFEWFKWRKRLQAWFAGDITDEAAEKEITEFLELVELPAEKILRQPQRAFERILRDVFLCQAGSIEEPVPSSAMPASSPT